jgi:hypothetical protein
LVVELRLKLQTKGISNTKVHEYFLKPFNPEAEMSIKTLKQVFTSNGIKENRALLLSRYLIEPREPNKKPTSYTETLSASQSYIATRLTSFIGPFKLYD